MTIPESHPVIFPTLYSSVRGNFMPDPPQTVVISFVTFLPGLVRSVDPGKTLLRPGRETLSVSSIELGCSILAVT